MATEEGKNVTDQKPINARRPGEEELDLARPVAERPDRDKWEDDPTEAAVSEEQLSNPNIHYGSRTEAGAEADGRDVNGAPSAGGRPPLSDHAHVPDSEPLPQGQNGDSFEEGSGSSLSPDAGAGVAGNGFRAVGHGRAALRSRDTEESEDAQSGQGTGTGSTLGAQGTLAATDDRGDRTEEDNPAAPVADPAIVAAADVTGAEDTAIALDLSAALADTDGSDTLTLTLTEVPDGASLSHGSDLGGGVWSVDPADLADLSITPPADSDADFTLTLNATTTESTETHTVSESFTVNVDAVADAANVGAADVSGFEDTAIALDLSAALADTDGSESLSVTISGVPDGSSLNHGSDQGGGVWSVDAGDLADLTITPPADSDADFTLTLNATSTDGSDTALVSESFTVNVDAVADAPVISTADAAGSHTGPIDLNLSAALTDTDGSETLSLTLSGVPDGASLNHGSDQGGGVWSVDPADLADLTISTPGHYHAHFDLTLTATSTDGGDSASTSQDFHLVVDPMGGVCTPLEGTYSSETLNGTDGHDCIEGHGGHDTIYGGGESDVIIGGTGNDNLYGDAGDDVFLVAQNEGYDEFTGGAGNDTVVATEDNVAIGLDRDYAGGVETISAGGHSGVSITGTYSSQNLDFTNTTLDGIEAIDGAGGHDTITGSAGDDVIRGGDGNDNLFGGAGDDTFEVGAGDDYDEFTGGAGNDTVVATEDNVAIGLDRDYAGGVETISAGGHSGVSITGTYSSQNLDFTNTTLDGIKAIDGAGGHDTITGSAGDDVIRGGDGNDNLFGGAGDDTFEVGAGDDYDEFTGGAGNDTVVATEDNVAIGLDRDYAGGVETISAGGHSGVSITGTYSSQNLDFTNTTLDGIEAIDGAGGHDTITGSAGDDVIRGGDGNDNLFGGAGDDTFEVGAGDDYDEFTGGAGNDTVVATEDNVAIGLDRDYAGGVETISAGGHSGVSITGTYSSQNLDFTNTTLDGIEAIDGAGGHDTITGSAGDDVIRGGDGNDNLFGGAGDDTFEVGAGDDYDEFTGGAGNDTVVATEDNVAIGLDRDYAGGVETISAGGHSGVSITGTYSSQNLDFTNTTLDGIEAIDGAGGHDTITGSAGDDVIRGGDGNDNLFGGAGDDTFEVGAGDDYDEFTGGAGNDTVVATEDNVAIGLDRDYAGGVETISAGGHSGVSITGTYSSQNLDFTNTTLDGIEAIDGAGGHDTITGSAGDDVIRGGDGNDNLFGGAGDDTFEVGAGDDYDEFTGGAGNDTVVATEDNVAIGLDRDYAGGVETISAGGHSGVSITGTYSSQNLDFTNTTLDGIEAIDGAGGHDTITGSAGDDVIRGGDGNDNLFGGAGDDTFEVGAGDDYDEFTGGAGNDTVVATEDNVAIGLDRDYAGGVETISAGGHSGVSITGTYSSQNLDFTNTTLDGIEAIDGAGGHDTITGSAGDDVIRGGDGNDNLFGGAGDDTFEVGAGDDYDEFTGGAGNDTVVATEDNVAIGLDRDYAGGVETISAGGHSGVSITGTYSSQNLDFTNTTLDGIEAIDGAGGHDTITGSAGDDVIRGGDGNDNLFGGDGDDTLYGNAGNDNLNGGDGSDSFVFGFGDGSDQVDGGIGGDWTDIIQLDGMTTGPGGGDWTFTIDAEDISSTGDDFMILTEDASGTITLSDGSEVQFEGIERIEW